MGFVLLKAQWLTAGGDWNWAGTFWLVRVRVQAPDISPRMTLWPQLRTDTPRGAGPSPCGCHCSPHVTHPPAVGGEGGWYGDIGPLPDQNRGSLLGGSSLPGSVSSGRQTQGPLSSGRGAR